MSERKPRVVGKVLEMDGISRDWGICSGAPCITNRRIMVDVLVGRFRAGESVTYIASDYELRERDVEMAIRFELERLRMRLPHGIQRHPEARRRIAECKAQRSTDPIRELTEPQVLDK